MQGWSTFIYRPVLATVLSLLMVLLGLLGYSRLSLREYPRIESPITSVRVDFTGAAAEVVETQVTQLLEDTLSTVAGLEFMESTSSFGRSDVRLSFRSDIDPNVAMSDVRDKVARIRGRLPDTIDEPVVSKSDPDAFPVIWVTLTSDTLSRLQLSELARQIGRPLLQTAPGAAEVRVFGERVYSMQIELDTARLAAYGITVQEIEAAIRNQNFTGPAGTLENSTRKLGVLALTSLRTPAEFAQLAIKNIHGTTLQLGAVARIYEDALDSSSRVRFNGQDGVALGVIRDSTANPLTLAQGVRQLLPQLSKNLPAGILVQVANDDTTFIERAINGVVTTVFEAVVLVMLVIFLFLRTLRASVIPLVTIPVSLISTFAILAAMGYSINVLTLLAFVLAIGLVVDDAIVVLENIYRHIEDGVPHMEAAVRGIRETGFAVIAMTLTLAAVFLPLAFTPGRTGQLFVEFAVALASSVLISGIVSLTLTPMMCAKLLRAHTPQPETASTMRPWSRALHYLDQAEVAMEGAYARGLRICLQRPLWLLGALGLVCAGVVYLFLLLPQEMAPAEDRGTVIINIKGPDGAPFSRIEPYLEPIERMARAVPEVDRVFSFLNSDGGNIFLRLVPWQERQRSAQAIADALRPQLARIAGVTAQTRLPGSLGQRGPGGVNLEYVISTSGSYEDLAQVLVGLQAQMADNPGLRDPESDLNRDQPQLQLSLDRARANDMGINATVVTTTLETMLNGRTVTRYQRGSSQYDVRLRAQASDRDSPESITTLPIKNASGTLVPLGGMVRLAEQQTIRELKHFNQRRAAKLKAGLAAGYTMQQAIDYMDNISKASLPLGYSTDLAGASREFKDSASAVYQIFGLALLFIFLVLAAQFESFVSPFIIMLSVPLSMLGALLALHLTGNTLNIFSQIGLVTLVGLITKHGILIVEFANQLRHGEHPLSKLEACMQAARQRLRPILMTTSAMVLGAVPLALASGAGAESRAQIGWVIVGGMTLGTLLTLFVIPALYVLIAPKRLTPLPQDV